MRTTLVLGLALVIAGGCSSPPPDGAQAAELTGAAPTAAPSALLAFLAGWVQVQHGALGPGTHVDVTHDAARLSACPAPTIFSFARFLPGGETFSSDEHLSFDVPAGASSVELWFHAVAPGCEQWDSDYGRNWRFPVIAAATAPGVTEAHPE
jgi:hypothetical protein